MLEKISRLTFAETVTWISQHKSGVIMCCTLNEILMAEKDPWVKQSLFSADLLTPDGIPLVWYLRWKYGIGERVYGPDLLGKFIKNKSTISKGKYLFVGDSNNQKYFSQYGEYILLPYKNEFTESDYQKITRQLCKSKAKIVWLGLGAKKQVLMAGELKKRGVKKIIITVGAGFDFLSGNIKQAPRWLRNNGGEWFYRLVKEPRRLMGRYLRIIRWLGNKVVWYFIDGR
jgi:N-acetylglucosaminyldiphosphoundecaprenol N-acetyl-beta-D-mannosaminyltransferase